MNDPPDLKICWGIKN